MEQLNYSTGELQYSKMELENLIIAAEERFSCIENELNQKRSTNASMVAGHEKKLWRNRGCEVSLRSECWRFE